MFKKISIIGLGLIGGSLGMKIKQEKISLEVIGVARRKQTIKTAIKKKAIDRGTLDIKIGVKDADLIIVCTPVGDIVNLVKKILPFLKPNCIITDVGSTKLKIVEEIEKILPENIYFLGGHPIAGSEKAGIENATSSVFENSLYIITPGKCKNKKVINLLKKFIIKLGAKPKILSPKEHDYYLARISHFPHILAATIVNTLKISKESKELINLAPYGKGFKDTTRIAESPSHLWVDIVLSNREEILKAISSFEKQLCLIKKFIKEKDRKKLQNTFDNASEIRKKI